MPIPLRKLGEAEGYRTARTLRNQATSLRLSIGQFIAQDFSRDLVPNGILAKRKIFNDAIEQANTDGFTGFRAAAEMSWALECEDAPFS